MAFSIRGFQKDNALRVDGLINPVGPTLQRIGEALSEDLGGRARSSRTPDVAHIFVPFPKGRTGIDLNNPNPFRGSLIDRVSEWLERQGASLVSGKVPTSQPASAPAQSVARYLADKQPESKPALPAVTEPPVQAPASQKASGAGFPHETTIRPVIRGSRERIQAVIENRPAVFNVSNNPDADASDPWYVSPSAGRTAVATFETLIDPRRQKVDPDLVKAIVFAENARGHYWGAAKAAEGLGVANSVFPMNINPEIWAPLGIDKTRAADPQTNIRAGVILIKRLTERLEDASPKKVGTDITLQLGKR